MLVGGDICKALLKQEIQFRGLFPWTSLWFVVGFVLFCLVLWFRVLGIFPEEVKRFTRCFSVALEVFSGKMIEVLNLPVALQWHPVTVKQCLKQQAPVNTARRKLMMERSQSGITWGRLCWGKLRRGDTLPSKPKPASVQLCCSSPSLPLTWLLDLLPTLRACSMVSIYRIHSCYIESPISRRRSPSYLGSPLYKPGHSCMANGLKKISFEWSICQLYSSGHAKNGSSPSHMF